VSTPRSAAECRERFAKEVAALGVDCDVEMSPPGGHERVRGLVDGKRVLGGDDDHPPYDLGSVLSGGRRGSSPRDGRARTGTGVTGCHAAIAETGSSAARSGPGRSRTASLLPPVDVAVARWQDLYSTMGESFAAEALRLGQACCRLSTGRRPRADIALILTPGVHGPARVIVVVNP
jgi:L-lactate dehydrogenase complex protein LldG